MEILTKIKEAVALTKTGNFHAAENIYNTLLAKNPDDIRILPFLGWLFIAQHNYSKAIDVFKKVNSFGADEINKFSTASLITRSTNDVSQVQMTLMSNLRMLFTAPCMAFFAIRKITLSNATLSWVAIGFLVAMLVMLITMIIIALLKL